MIRAGGRTGVARLRPYRCSPILAKLRTNQGAQYATKSVAKAESEDAEAGRVRDKIPPSQRVDAGFDLENLPTFAFDDVPSLTHLLLDKQRDLRRYLRLIEYEMPRLKENTGIKDFTFHPPHPTKQPIRIRSTHYLTESGHPASRKAVMTVKVDDLELNGPELHKFILLAGPRYDPSQRIFKMNCELYPALRMNVKWCSDVFERLLKESKTNPEEFVQVNHDFRHHLARLKKSVKARRKSGGGLGIRNFPSSWLPKPSGHGQGLELQSGIRSMPQIRSFSTSSRTLRSEGELNRRARPENDRALRQDNGDSAQDGLDANDASTTSPGLSPTVQRATRRLGRVPKFLAPQQPSRVSITDSDDQTHTEGPAVSDGLSRRVTRRFAPGETYNPIDLSLEKASMPRMYQKMDRLAAFRTPPLSIDTSATSMVPTGGGRTSSQGDASDKLLDPFKALSLDPRLEYRNSMLLSEYVTEMGRIKNKRETGLSWKSQRQVGKAIRRARAMGLMPKFYKLYPNKRNRE